MSPTRREFIKQLGVTLAALATARCASRTSDRGVPIPTHEAPTPSREVLTRQMTCYEVTKAVTMVVYTESPEQLTRQAAILTGVATRSLNPEATRQALAAIGRERLQSLWQQFGVLAEATKADADQSTQMRDSLAADHRAALEDLVALHELSEAVAGQVQVAFEAAVGHVWRANAPVTCYAPAVINYTPGTSQQLVQQADLLAERDDLDPQVVAQVQAAIAREVAFLNMSPEQVDALYQQILSGQGNQPVPAFEEVELDMSPEDLEAARFLVDLLLGGTP